MKCKIFAAKPNFGRFYSMEKAEQYRLSLSSFMQDEINQFLQSNIKVLFISQINKDTAIFYDEDNSIGNFK